MSTDPRQLVRHWAEQVGGRVISEVQDAIVIEIPADAYEADIQAMLNDPGNESGEQDDPDWVDTRKEVSPWDFDPPFDTEDEEPF